MGYKIVVPERVVPTCAFNPESTGGDLFGMGYVRSSMVCKLTNNNLPRRHLWERDYEGQRLGRSRSEVPSPVVVEVG